MTSVLQMPSLITGAALGVVVNMWTRQLYRRNRDNHTRKLTDVVEMKDEIQLLPIAPQQKPLILSFVQPLTQYLDRWLEFWHCSMREHQESIEEWLNKVNLAKNLRVTLLGTVDWQATAKEILKSGRLSDTDAFRLVCINCMVEEAMSLWPRVKNYFVDKVYSGSYSDESSEVIVFSRYANEALASDGAQENLQSFAFSFSDSSDAWHEFALRSATNVGNAVAMDHFLKQFDPNKRSMLVQGIAESVFVGFGPQNAALLRLVISLLGSHWHEFVRVHARDVFLTFARWPLCLLFFELTLESRRHLTSRKYFDVLLRLAMDSEGESVGLMDPAAKLFEAVWADTPLQQKLEVIDMMLESEVSYRMRSVVALLESMSRCWALREAFLHWKALFHFLSVGYRQTSECLRMILYEYVPSSRGDERVEQVLTLYEEEDVAPCLIKSCF